MIIFPSADSHKYSIYFTETYVKFGAKYKWKLSKDSFDTMHIPTSPLLIFMREESEKSRSDDDKDIEATEEPDKEADAELARVALEDGGEVLARPGWVCSGCG